MEYTVDFMKIEQTTVKICAVDEQDLGKKLCDMGVYRYIIRDMEVIK